MHMFEDEDVKIFGANKIENEADVLIRIVEIMKKQRANGNMDRAKEMGEAIALRVYKLMDEMFIWENYAREINNKNIPEQIEKLITFTVEAELHVLLEKYSVSTMAVNAFYDKLIELDENLYNNITDAYTYYYLVLRKGGDVAGGIGKQFAKLCSAKDDEVLQDAGKEVFETVCEILRKEIENAGFVND